MVPMHLRRRYGLGALTVLFGLAGPACDSDECQTNQDCASGQQCRSGVCEAKSTRVPPGLVDGGFRDAQPMIDTGTSTVVDSGTAPPVDGGVRDGGSLGRPDAAPPDAGSPDATTLSGWGEIAVEDLRGSGGGVTARAKFVDPGSAVFGVVSHVFDAGNNDQCQLIQRRLMSGTVSSYTAASISINFPSSVQNVGALPLALMPTGVAGEFGTPAQLQTPAFDNGSVRFMINAAAAAANSLDTFMASVSAPIRMTLRTTEASSYPLLTNGQLDWTPGPSRTPPRTVTVEVYDRDREVVLTCRTDDDGDFFIPNEPRNAFLFSNVTEPTYIEVRYDQSTVRNVPLAAGGATVVTTFRASDGHRLQLR